MDAASKQSFSFGIFIAINAYLCFAIGSVFVRMFNEDFPTIEIIFFQNLISFLFILPFALKNGITTLKTANFGYHLIRDITGMFSCFCYFFAIKHLNLVDATVLAYTAPFYTPFIAHFLTKEKFKSHVWYTIILGFIGIGFIFKPDGDLLQPGALIGIAAGILSSVSLVSIKILNQRKEALFRTLFYLFSLGTIVSLPFSILQWQTSNFPEILLLIGIGGSFALGQLLLTIAYRHGAASFLSPLSYSMVIFTGLFSWIIFNRMPTWMSFMGAFLIILGGLLSYFFKKWLHFNIKLFQKIRSMIQIKKEPAPQENSEEK